MGRAERRQLERHKRIEERKNKILMTREEIRRIKEKISTAASEYNVENLMTCFALAEHRLYGFGPKRILRTLRYVDELMGPIAEETASIEDYKNELEKECHVVIRCGED